MKIDDILKKCIEIPGISIKSSETSLKNYFRGVYGQNISVYLREIRLKKAAELFASTNLSVSEVAEQVGYMNQSKFAAVFKKQYGQTPLEYRRSIHLKQG